jgi:hypothetical protein
MSGNTYANSSNASSNASAWILYFLNRLSALSTNSDAAGMLQPQQLEQAVAEFCAYEVYEHEALMLLDSFTCTSIAVWKTLEVDGYLEGSATISGSNAGNPLTFQTPRFTWWPLDANGSSISNNYSAASGGSMVVVRHDNSPNTVNSVVVGYPNLLKLIQEAQTSTSSPLPNCPDPSPA